MAIWNSNKVPNCKKKKNISNKVLEACQFSPNEGQLHVHWLDGIFETESRNILHTNFKIFDDKYAASNTA